MPRTSTFDRQRLAGLLADQHGVVSRGQALALGMTCKTLKYRMRKGGPWQAILPGVYLDHTGTATADQRDMSALLYTGPCSVLTGPAALRRFGFRGADASVVDVLVPTSMQRRGASFVRTHRTSRLPGRICVAGEIRFALPARAAADAARLLTALADVRALVAGAVQQGICPLSQLAAELAAGPVRGSAPLRRTLAEVADGIRSSAEADMRDLIMSAGLPAPMFNPRLFAGRDYLGSPDCWWPSYGVAVEVDSRAWHFSPGDWEATLAKDAWMGAHGIVVLHFTPGQIRTQPGFVIATLRKAMRQGRPQPHIRALPAAR